jgi:TPP-dependent pyruvate/acetoin dehydrogenase alpha subunit
MFLIREFEEAVLRLFAQGELSGTTHAYIGQEADAVGLLAHLTTDDIVVSNHRCHGHYLAAFNDPEGLLKELMGKADGVCGGMGGSQHLHRQNFYTNGVLGGTLPWAAGMALAEKLKGTGRITVAFMGDGALGEGVVYETFNIASLWRLPMLFVIENNRYAQSTPVELQLAGSITARAQAFGIETAELETTDVEAIYHQAQGITRLVRSEGRPFCWVLHTYRLCPHSKGDDHRDPAELARYAERDPIRIARQRLHPELAGEIEARCRYRIERAIEAARAAPSPMCGKR